MKIQKLLLALTVGTVCTFSAPIAANAGGSFSFSIGHHHDGYGYNHGGHGQNGHNNHHSSNGFRICFFSKTHYRGHRYCESNFRVKPKVSYNWRNKIRSIKIYRIGNFGHHSPSIRLCNDYHGHGYCKTYYKGSGKLHPNLYRNVYSYQISQ